ncbi:hypothetical protein GGI35DRAFT_436276 [Trichoderma velutinum]
MDWPVFSALLLILALLGPRAKKNALSGLLDSVDLDGYRDNGRSERSLSQLGILSSCYERDRSYLSVQCGCLGAKALTCQYTCISLGYG